MKTLDRIEYGLFLKFVDAIEIIAAFGLYIFTTQGSFVWDSPMHTGDLDPVSMLSGGINYYMSLSAQPVIYTSST